MKVGGGAYLAVTAYGNEIETFARLWNAVVSRIGTIANDIITVLGKKVHDLSNEKTLQCARELLRVFYEIDCGPSYLDNPYSL